MHTSGSARRAYTTAAVMVAAALATAPSARADEVAYLVNVAVRPGYHFASATDALDYGRSICGRVSQGLVYAQLMRQVKDYLATTDEYQATYLISQAVNELCPSVIWQLRTSAADYRPAAPA
jgi:hypothetical protein